MIFEIAIYYVIMLVKYASMLGVLSPFLIIFLIEFYLYKIMIYNLNKIFVIAVTTLSGLVLGLKVGLLRVATAL